eukprot:457765-Rhodomonas_salina.2
MILWECGHRLSEQRCLERRRAAQGERASNIPSHSDACIYCYNLRRGDKRWPCHRAAGNTRAPTGQRSRRAEEAAPRESTSRCSARPSGRARGA